MAGFHKQLVVAVMQKVVDYHMELVAAVMPMVGAENCSGQLVVAENYNEQLVVVVMGMVGEVENGTLEEVAKVMEVASKQ